MWSHSFFLSNLDEIHGFSYAFQLIYWLTVMLKIGWELFNTSSRT